MYFVSVYFYHFVVNISVKVRKFFLGYLQAEIDTEKCVVVFYLSLLSLNGYTSRDSASDCGNKISIIQIYAERWPLSSCYFSWCRLHLICSIIQQNTFPRLT